MDKKTALEIFGTDSWKAMLDMTLALLKGLEDSPESTKLEWVFNTIQAMKPRDAAEAMLCAELVLLHGQFFRMLELSRQDAPRSVYFLKFVTAARELSKTFQQGVEALSRYRSGGKQQIIVSHVSVQDGAQAAFTVGGNVNGGGGGANEQSTP
jgi:hypothetical protein